MLKYSTGAEALISICTAILSLFLINGCDDAGVVTPGTNPNVVTYDSIFVEEDTTGGVELSAIDLFNGVPVNRTTNNRDVNLNGDSTGSSFYLGSAVFETKFFLVASGVLSSDFDTLKTVPGGTLDSADFTNWSTDTWGTWSTSNINDPHSIYCFWLKGRQAAGQNNGVNIFGIMQVRQATDSTPGIQGGYRMSLRVRINKNGENDFNPLTE